MLQQPQVTCFASLLQRIKFANTQKATSEKQKNVNIVLTIIYCMVQNYN